MKDKQKDAQNSSSVEVYAIMVEGHLDSRWQEWFDDFSITLTEDGNTILRGTVQDQAALHGILNKVCNLGLKLISVNRVESSVIEETRREK